ncbi:uncharacterized protein N7498_009050, partial [Penicillium cinerascens]
LPQVEEGRSAELQALEGHLDWVLSMTFSPNVRLLASASPDKPVCLWDVGTGALHQTLEGGSSLITNLGALDVQSMSENHASRVTHMTPGIFIGQVQWIKLNGKRVLRLPPGSQPNCSAINSNLLALGHLSERVSFIGFRV